MKDDERKEERMKKTSVWCLHSVTSLNAKKSIFPIGDCVGSLGFQPEVYREKELRPVRVARVASFSSQEINGNEYFLRPHAYLAALTRRKALYLSPRVKTRGYPRFPLVGNGFRRQRHSEFWILNSVSLFLEI